MRGEDAAGSAGPRAESHDALSRRPRDPPAVSRHGHTGGDVVVYVPKVRVLCSGDLLVNGLANLIDGFPHI
jgi:glyoxylase-like metal-dependent hydrolase (beta-lactamase superfamily II)